MKKHSILILLLAFFMAAAVPKRRLQSPSYYAQKNNKFAFDLYQKVTQKTHGNIFFSPYSISAALTMTYAGADGGTADEMAKTMHFDVNEPYFHYGYGAYSKKVSDNAADNVELTIANQLWGEKNYGLQDDFVSINKQAYQADFKLVDFVGQPDKERLVINKWIADQTNDRIKDLLGEGSITTDTRLVLTNAIYFKGDWLSEFEERQTREREFNVSVTKKIETPFMHSSSSLAYWENKDMQMVMLPYKGEKQSMVVVLPKDPANMPLIEQQMANSQMTKAITAKKTPVNLAIPKFKFSVNLGVKKYLQTMGMKEAFTPGANFSKMTPSNDLWISDVVHKAFIEIDEKGSEAAAATAVIMTVESTMPDDVEIPKEFTADHPFLIYIVDNETRAILFMGRVAKPEL